MSPACIRNMPNSAHESPRCVMASLFQLIFHVSGHKNKNQEYKTQKNHICILNKIINSISIQACEKVVAQLIWK